MSTEKILSETIVHETRHCSVLMREIAINEKLTVHWEVFKQRNTGVSVIPVDENGWVYLVEEYQGGVHRRMITYAKGGIDAGETAEQAVAREMMEELGLKANKLTPLYTAALHPGYNTATSEVFIAQGLTPVERNGGDEEHHMEVIHLPIDEAIKRVSSAELVESRTLASLFLIKQRLGL